MKKKLLDNCELFTIGRIDLEKRNSLRLPVQAFFD
jgi:hypothetical protein